MRKDSTYRFSNQKSSIRLFLILLGRSAYFAGRYCAFLTMLSVSPALLWAQSAAKPTKVFVWTFRSNSGDRAMLDNITDEFESVLHESKKYTLLERRNFGTLLSRSQEEATDMSSVGSKDQAAMHTQGAEAVFFGNIFHDVDSGQVRITVTLEGFDSQILSKKSREVRPPEWQDAEARQKVFRELLGMPVSNARRNSAPVAAQNTAKAASNPPSQPNQQIVAGTVQGGIVTNNGNGNVSGIGNGTGNINGNGSGNVTGGIAGNGNVTGNGNTVNNYGAPKIDRKKISLDPALLHTYVGEYSANPYTSVTVTEEGNQLFAEGGGWPKTEMLAEAPREFFFERADIQITFLDSGPDGQASGMIVHQRAGDTPYPRSSNGAGSNGAKHLADSSYDSLTRFLDHARGHAAMVSNAQQAATASRDDQIMNLYHGSNYEVMVKNALDRMNVSHQPVGDVMKLSQNVHSLDDIRKLRDGFKALSDPGARYPAATLDMLVRRAEMLSATPSRSNSTTSDASAINVYRMSYGRAIDDNLAKLKEKGVNVENLTQLQRNLQSLEDLERLAAGFKQLSESLSR